MTQTDLIRPWRPFCSPQVSRVSAARMALALDCSEQEVHQAAQQLADSSPLTGGAFGWCGWSSSTRCARLRRCPR